MKLKDFVNALQALPQEAEVWTSSGYYNYNSGYYNYEDRHAEDLDRIFETDLEHNRITFMEYYYKTYN